MSVRIPDALPVEYPCAAPRDHAVLMHTAVRRYLLREHQMKHRVKPPTRRWWERPTTRIVTAAGANS